jgi:membrane-associated PAP2 superfamily phosphatase
VPGEAQPPRRRGRRELLVELALPLAALLAATAVFWLTPLDLAAADRFRTPCCAWPVAERPFWHFLYLYGIFLGVALTAAALVILPLSYWYPRRLHRWRRPALFLVLVAAIGPGLLVNGLFKDHYGRPRPREVQALGGTEPFRPVWLPGPDPDAKSFPCGHCAMGFYLATPYLILRRRRRGLALAFAGAGLAAGGLLGVARMAAGGHFLSDVVWSGGIVWLVAVALHRLLGVDRALEAPDAPAHHARDPRKARLVTGIAGGLLAALLAFALLATPYFSSGKTFTLGAAELAALRAPALELDLGDAAVEVRAGEGLAAAYDVQAFGLPFSRVGWAFRQGPEAAVLSIAQRGLFTERRTQIRLVLPAAGPRPVRLRLGRGRLALDLAGFSPAARLDVEVEEGEAHLTGAEPAPGAVRVRVHRGVVSRE